MLRQNCLSYETPTDAGNFSAWLLGVSKKWSLRLLNSDGAFARMTLLARMAKPKGKVTRLQRFLRNAIRLSHSELIGNYDQLVYRGSRDSEPLLESPFPPLSTERVVLNVAMRLCYNLRYSWPFIDLVLVPGKRYWILSHASPHAQPRHWFLRQSH
jgi:hypothetical protein